MDDMQGKIERLQALQTQIRRWRLGGVVAILAIVGCCLWHVRGQALALLNDGPTHDVFMTQLKDGLVRDVVPEAKKLTAKTLNRLGPAMEKEIAKIEKRIPEVEARAEQEMNLLRQNLPERAERALRPTIGKALETRLAVWKKQYPTLSAEQLAAAGERLTNEAHERMGNIATVVILPYENAYEKIIDDLGEIRKLEVGHAEVDPWDLAVVSIGLLHEELLKMNPPARPTFVAALDKKEIK